MDTSVILDDAANIFALSQGGSNKVVIPETVLDEIDAKKKRIWGHKLSGQRV